MATHLPIWLGMYNPNRPQTRFTNIWLVADCVARGSQPSVMRPGGTGIVRQINSIFGRKLRFSMRAGVLAYCVLITAENKQNTINKMHISTLSSCEIAIQRSVVCIYYCVLVFCLALKTWLMAYRKILWLLKQSAQLRCNSTNRFEFSLSPSTLLPPSHVHLAGYTSKAQVGESSVTVAINPPMCKASVALTPDALCRSALLCHKKVCILFKAFKPPPTGSNPNNQSCNGKAMRLEKMCGELNRVRFTLGLVDRTWGYHILFTCLQWG